MLKIEYEYNQGILFARLKGTLERRNSYKINNYLIPVIEKHNIKYLVYNFENLKDIKENSINTIINTKVSLRKIKGNMFFCQINENVKSKLKNIRCKRINNEKDIFKLIGEGIND